MATVDSLDIVQKIIKGNGYYPGDHIRVVKIVQYQNMWGGTSYGLVYEGEQVNRYEESPACDDVKTIWSLS